MPLESCERCGYAVSTVDGGCRHCAPRGFAPAQPKWSDTRLRLPLIVAVFGMAVLVYQIFFA